MIIKVIDLFCGVGGLTHGMQQSGLNVIAGIDIENSCRYAYEKNNGSIFINKDIKEVTSNDLNYIYDDANIRVLSGCAPCQPFSNYTQAKNKSNDKKWPLLYEFSRLINDILPEIVTMENVPEVVKHSVYNDFVLSLKKLGYSVFEKRVNCLDYGIPQKRYRQVLLASRLGDIKLIPPTIDIPVTVRDAIGSLSKISDGETCQTDYLHRSSKLSSLNKNRIKNSIPGGSWLDWPSHLRLNCHKKTTGKGYSAVYGRMEWEKPSPTITTLCYGYGNGRFGHPEQDRAISLREAAILQSFPDNYIFCEPNQVNMRAIGKMIGNAVPVKLGKAIGDSILLHLNTVL